MFRGIYVFSSLSHLRRDLSQIQAVSLMSPVLKTYNLMLDMKLSRITCQQFEELV